MLEFIKKMRAYTEEEIKIILDGIEKRIPKYKLVNSNFHGNRQEFNENLKKLNINYPRFSTKSNRIIKHNLFENLEDPEVQYWLGWLATDGYVTLKGNRISLSVSIKDLDVLEKFKKKQIQDLMNLIYEDACTFMNRKYNLALAIRNDGVESPKVGEPASGIPSQDTQLIESKV